MVWASFMVVPAARMCWGSKVIMACISRMVAYVKAWYMLSLVLQNSSILSDVPPEARITVTPRPNESCLRKRQ